MWGAGQGLLAETSSFAELGFQSLRWKRIWKVLFSWRSCWKPVSPEWSHPRVQPGPGPATLLGRASIPAPNSDGFTSQRGRFSCEPCNSVMIISALPLLGQMEKLRKVPALQSRYQSKSHYHTAAHQPGSHLSAELSSTACLLLPPWLFFSLLSAHFGEKRVWIIFSWEASIAKRAFFRNAASFQVKCQKSHKLKLKCAGCNIRCKQLAKLESQWLKHQRKWQTVPWLLYSGCLACVTGGKRGRLGSGWLAEWWTHCKDSFIWHSSCGGSDCLPVLMKTSCNGHAR